VQNSRLCFVIMPFKPELNYFYLYIQKYLSEKHALRCERGDHRVLTIPLLEKIRKQILDADVIIGDITGRNSNVFYELGLADAYRRKVILITSDPVEDVPTDVRHLEFIKYDLNNHVEFLSKLDNAIHNVFMERYSKLYDDALELLNQFNSDLGRIHSKASREIFQSRVITKAKNIGGIPKSENEGSYADFLLPRIIEDSADSDIMQSVIEWLGKKYSGKGDA